jgi:C4-dicarboxylate transporter, DctQ subunit
VLARARVAVDRLEEILMALLLAAMTVLTFVQVVLRYVFGTGFVWSLEVTTYCFAWLVLIGMSQGVRTRSHIAVDILATRLSVERRRALGWSVIVLCLIYTAMMLYGSLIFVERLYVLGHYARDIPLPRWLLVVILPIGFAMLGLRFVELGTDLLKGRVSGSGFGRTSA